MTKTKKEIKNKKKLFSLRIFNIVLLLFIIVSGVYYLTGINNLTVKGFRLQELKREVNRLSSENKKIKLQAMNLESYNNLSQRAEKLNMVAVGEIDYITTALEVMAKK